MGLRVGGVGVLPQTVVDALRPREADLGLILNLPRAPIELPKGKAAQQKLAAELDRQLTVLTGLIQAAEPELKAELQHLHNLAREARLDLEGRLLSWAVTSADRRPVEAPLESAEAQAVFALFGPTFSNGEMEHALTVLDAHLAPEDRRTHVHALAEATAERADQVGKRTSKASRGVFGARAFPVLGGLIAARAITTLAQLEPAVAMAVNATAIQLGFQLGRRSGEQAVANTGYQFGVNRFEGEADHDLALLYDRATKLHQSLWKKSDAEAQPIIDREVALLRFLTARRRETWNDRQVPALEQRAVAKFEQLAKLLAERGVDGARGPIEGLDLKRSELEKLPSLPNLDRLAHPLDEAKTLQSFQTALVQAAKRCLTVVNPGLRRLVDSLENRHLAAGSPLNEAELETLRRVVGPAPNVSEVLALGKLAQGGHLKFDALWPDAQLRDFEGRVLDPADARLLFDTLGARDTGTRVEAIGRIIGLISPFLGSAAAYGTALGLGSPGLDSLQGWTVLLGSLGAALTASISGYFLGQHVEKHGQSIKLSTGLEPSLAIGREYALALPRLLEPAALLTGTLGEVTTALRREAGVLEVMVASVDGARKELQDALLSLAPKPGEAPEIARERELLTQALSQLEGAQGVHYQVLQSVVEQLRALSASGDLAEIRRGYAEARLEIHGLMPLTWSDIISSQSQHELSPELETYYRLKHQMLGELQAYQPGQPISPNLARWAEIITNGHKEIPKAKRPEKDALDKLAAQLVKAQQPGADAKKVVQQKLLDEVRSPAYADALKQERLQTSPITKDRAAEIAQEAITALWTQLLPTYGLVPDGLEKAPPKLDQVQVIRVPGADDNSLPSFRVEGRILAGNKVSITVNAAGMLDPRWEALQVDLGPRLLAKLATEAVQHHLAALGTPGSAQTTLLSRSDDGRCTFLAKTPQGDLEITIGPKGELDAGAIQAR